MLLLHLPLAHGLWTSGGACRGVAHALVGRTGRAAGCAQAVGAGSYVIMGEPRVHRPVAAWSLHILEK